MKRYRAIIKPETAFITPLIGDTLFGQCCWALRNQHGERSLVGWLEGYTNNNPFLVVSDAFLRDYLMRPTIPLEKLGFVLDRPELRKSIKGKVNIPVSALGFPLMRWGESALSDGELANSLAIKELMIEQGRTHNSINRKTGTTGSDGGFSPYDRQLTWYHPGLELSIYMIFDESRISAEAVHLALSGVGAHGFGKEASSGLGKFSVTSFEEWNPHCNPSANAWYTLAPCAPQGLCWVEESCYYQPFVRFGRHGDRAVHTGKPFKNPVLLATAGAILTPSCGMGETFFTGQGLGNVSKAITSTVQQGYAPVLPVTLA